MNGHGGARPGAGRKPKAQPDAMTAAIVQALAAAAVGQSSVSLELDSKNSVKPQVSVYGNDVTENGKRAEAEFDRLMDKYHPRQPQSPASLDAYSDADLALIGLQRIKS